MKKLTDEQKARIKRKVKSGSFNARIELLTLMTEGYEPEEAQQLLKKEIIKVQNEGDNKYFPFVFAAMAGFMLAIFGVTDITWHAIAAAVIALIGYLANQDEPIAVVAGSLAMVLLMPITSSGSPTILGE